MSRQPESEMLLRAKVAVSRKYKGEPSGKLRGAVGPVRRSHDGGAPHRARDGAIVNFDQLVTEMLEREAKNE